MNISIGEYIKVIGELEKVNKHGNFWEFNFNSYLLDNNVKYRFINFQIEQLHKYGIKFWFFNIIENSNSLTKLFVFQQKHDDEIYSELVVLGISYLLNFSGANIYILSYFLNRKLFKNSKTYKKYRIILILFMFFYSWLLSFKLFILKASILLLIGWFENNFKFKLSRNSKISLTWIITLFINPLFLFNIGFIYTIFAYFFIKEFKDKKKSTRIIYNFIIIYAVFFPLQVFYSYQINWFSELIEILLIPFISFCFLFSFLFFIPYFDIALNFTYDILKNYIHIFHFINPVTICGSFSVFYLIIYFIIFKLLICLDIKWKKIKKFLLFLLLFNAFWIIENNQFNKIEPKITMLNVGNGNSFILEYKFKTFIFDAGRGSGYSKNSFEQYLKYSGSRKIEAAFISHNHLDHYDQLEQIKKTYKFKNLYYNYDFKTNFSFKDMQITNFIETNNSDENDNSQVSIVKINNKKMVFTGDITKKREKNLLSDEQFLNEIKGGVDFLQVPHHGSKTSSSKKFIKTLNPKFCFISAENKKNRPFPNQETLETLNENNCETFVTAGENSFTFNLNKNYVKKI